MTASKKLLNKWNWIIIVVVILMVIITPMSLYAASDIEKKDLNDTARTQLGGTYSRLPDGITHYELSGPKDGQVVVLVHSYTIPMYVWDAQVNDLTKAGFRVLRYDLYGTGYSDRPVADYSQEFYRKQLLNLMDALEIKGKIDLVGIQMGGGLAVDFTANYPDRVRKLVIADPIINSIKNNFNIMILRLPILGEFFMRLVTTGSLAQYASGLTAKSVKAAEYKKIFSEQTNFKGFERAMLSTFRSDATTDYRTDYQTTGKQDRKIMLIWGTNDEYITGGMVQEITKAMPQVEFVKLDWVGRDPQVEVPECFNSIVIDFLKR